MGPHIRVHSYKGILYVRVPLYRVTFYTGILYTYIMVFYAGVFVCKGASDCYIWSSFYTGEFYIWGTCK